jgi:hypothetical protein
MGKIPFKVSEIVEQRCLSASRYSEKFYVGQWGGVLPFGGPHIACGTTWGVPLPTGALPWHIRDPLMEVRHPSHHKQKIAQSVQIDDDVRHIADSGIMS